MDPFNSLVTECVSSAQLLKPLTLNQRAVVLIDSSPHCPMRAENQNDNHHGQNSTKVKKCHSLSTIRKHVLLSRQIDRSERGNHSHSKSRRSCPSDTIHPTFPTKCTRTTVGRDSLSNFPQTRRPYVTRGSLRWSVIQTEWAEPCETTRDVTDWAMQPATRG